jgi:glycosyltransferase involved in cell wall biosynthesis
MKVLHVIPSISPVRGGPSRAILDMVRALQDRDIDVTIATTNDDGENLLNVQLGMRIEVDRIPTYFFSRWSPPISALREFAFSGTFTIWLLQNISKYDLVHVHALFSYTSTVTMAIARLRGIPYLITPHGLLCKWSLQQGASKKQAYLSAIERANLNRSQAIHFTCQQEQDDALDLNFKSATFILPLALADVPLQIPNAADLLRQNLHCPLDEPIILFLSRLHYVKGLDYLIPALGKLTHHRFTFVLAGSGTPEYEAEIRALIRSSGLEDRTHLVGFVEGEQKNILIQGANLFAATSHLESFGLAVLEALAVGTPVLVTPGVGLATVVRDNDLGYVADLNIDAIATTLDRYLANPDRSPFVGNRARQFIFENYNWDRIMVDTIQVYRAIVDRQPLLINH